LRVANPSGYIDYQDCKYLAAARRSARTQQLPDEEGRPRFPLGGFEIVDLAKQPRDLPDARRAVDRQRAADDAEPFWVEPTSAGLRAYFMPEDEKSTLYIYEAEIK
jgi:hypothetical protein